MHIGYINKTGGKNQLLIHMFLVQKSYTLEVYQSMKLYVKH